MARYQPSLSVLSKTGATKPEEARHACIGVFIMTLRSAAALLALLT
jgi:hypothetical protein